MAIILGEFDPLQTTTPKVTVFFHDIVEIEGVKTVISSGALRIGGDAPNGLVLHGVAPVSRTIDLFDTDTNAHVARTTSSPLDGTYEFPNLSDRNYFVICRGLPGERDQIYNNVSPV